MAHTSQEDVASRLEAMDDRLARLETLLLGLTQRFEPHTPDVSQVTASIQTWVTDYVSLRLQQLVPETCEHPPEPEASDGPYLPGTTTPCTEEVVHRVGRIPIPFVRQMVVDKVAQQAHADSVARVDVEFFEKSATF